MWLPCGDLWPHQSRFACSPVTEGFSQEICHLAFTIAQLYKCKIVHTPHSYTQVSEVLGNLSPKLIYQVFLSCGCLLCLFASVFSGITSFSFGKALLIGCVLGFAVWKHSPQTPTDLYIKENQFPLNILKL